MLESEREVVKEERRMRTDNSPTGTLIEAFFGAAYKAHNYRWPVVGWMKDLDGDQPRADCQDFFNTHYNPKNVTVLIVGAIDHETAFKRVEQLTWAWQAQPRSEPTPQVEPELTSRREETVRFATNTPLLLGGWKVPAAKHEDIVALKLLGKILSDGASVTRSLVYEQEPAQYAAGDVLTQVDNGQFYPLVGGKARPSVDIDQVAAAMLKVVEQVKKNGVTPSEQGALQAQAEAESVAKLKKAHGIASLLGWSLMYHGDWRPALTELDRLRAVQPGGRAARRQDLSGARSDDGGQAAPRSEGGHPMRSLMLFSLVAGCATAPQRAATPQATASESARQTLRYQVEGVSVIRAIDTSLPTIRLTYQFPQGADAEQPSELGATRLLASLMTKGSKGRSAMEVAQADALGASISGSASRDAMTFSAGGVEPRPRSLVDAPRRHRAPPEPRRPRVRAPQASSLAGMKSSRTRGQSLAQLALLKLMYNGDRLGTPISGDEASVGTLGLETLKSLYKQSVHPGGLVIGVFGDAHQSRGHKAPENAIASLAGLRRASATATRGCVRAEGAHSPGR